MIKNIFSFLSIFSLIFLAGCGGSSGGNSSPTTQPPASNPTVTLTSYTSETVAQQASVSTNVVKIVTSDINSPEVTSVSFKVSTQGGFETFSFDMNNISINGNMPTSITDDILVFDNSFQSFSNNEWVLNIDSIIEEFRGFGGIIQLDEIEISLKDSANKEYLSEKSSFTLNITKNVDFTNIEFIQNNLAITEKTLIAEVKAVATEQLTDGSLDIYFDNYNSELAGKMYDATQVDNMLPELTPFDTSLIESIIIVNNNTKEESVYYDTSNISLPIDITSNENTLDFSIYATKTPGLSLEHVGILLNLQGFSNTLHQNRWKYLENSISFYDSYLEMERTTQDQSGIVQDQIEKKIEDYVLNVLKCETCLGEVILNNIVYKYDSINVDVSTSSIKFLIDGLPVYDDVIAINENDKFILSPDVLLTGESNLEVSVIMNVLDVNQTAKFGIYPETFTFFIVETGETITLDYQPGQPYIE